MNIDDQVIETIEDLEAFLHLVESGALGLEGVAGIALAKTNSDETPFCRGSRRQPPAYSGSLGFGIRLR